MEASKKDDLVQRDPDVRLMLAVKEGEEPAFERLLDRYETPIINFIYRYTGNRHDAEDLAQEVFLRVYRSAERYEPKARFSTWIFRIAVNVCLDYRKKCGRDMLGHAEPQKAGAGEDEEEEREPADTNALPMEKAAELRQTEEDVRSALCSLPEKQRIAVTLKIYEDKSYAEVAEILDCSVSSVESLIFRARQTLQKRLGPILK